VKDSVVKDKNEGSTRLTYTGLHGGLEHLKIKTRLIDERFTSPVASLRQGKPNRSPKLLRFVQTEPIWGVNRRIFFFFFYIRKMGTAGAQGGESAAGEEEMEDHEEMDEDSRSNVSMLATRGTFRVGTLTRATLGRDPTLKVSVWCLSNWAQEDSSVHMKRKRPLKSLV
jgi:hypothetical protein